MFIFSLNKAEVLALQRVLENVTGLKAMDLDGVEMFHCRQILEKVNNPAPPTPSTSESTPV